MTTQTTSIAYRHTERPHATNDTTIDARQLERELRGAVRGEVRFGDGDRALYATDGSNYRQVPIGVVVPRDANDVVQTVAIARAHGAPILGRGCGTSLCGQCCNVAVVIDMSKYMHDIVRLDPGRREAVVQPGVILDSLRDEAERHQLTFAPDPSTHSHCTLGGMIGNNSCGVHSLMAGKTDDNLQELEVLTYDGLRMRVGPTSDEEYQRILAAGGRRAEIYRGLRDLRDRYADEIRRGFPDIARRVSGYNLPYLLPERGFDVAKALAGSESTCALVLEAKTRLVHSPPARSLLVLGYPSIYDAGDHVPAILQAGPIGLEGVDDMLVEDMKKKGLHPRDLTLLPDGNGFLLCEFGGDTKEESDARAHELMDRLRGKRDAPSMKLFDDPAQEHMVWKVRESGLGATARVPGEKDTWEGWEDSAVAPEKLGGYLRDLRALFDRYGYACALYGHFGQGCVHTRIDFDLTTAAGIGAFRSFIDDASSLVVSYGGSISGEHGDGQSKAEFLPKMFGPELMRAFREFKAIWDPGNRMNPGKIVDPYRIDENLRMGAYYDPPQPRTWFRFPDDDGSFARATARCVGVGDCRRLDGGTMCPSFMVTREEKDSTRGRAHLLFEMLQGDPLHDGWKDESVREALDLCLACKGCRGDCPVNVDMATYKAEVLSHYYERRLRPRSAYAMGLIYWWARLASRAPALANFMTHAPLLSTLAKAAGGIAQERTLPSFASQTFRSWFQQRTARNEGGPPVILFPDTFNNHFFPGTAKAAVDVLEAAGFDVRIPPRILCCGRPLYDWGMLGTASRLLRQMLDTLHPWIAEGVPMVVLEPSCFATFRDELINLLPGDHDALRLSEQTFLLGEFLDKFAKDWEPPQVHAKALLHAHCHQKSLVGMHAAEVMLDRMGIDYEAPDTGCCGMAGAFGFEAAHYDVAIKAGERVLLPAVRNAEHDEYVITDGFSCREQIAQTTDRRALHLAEVLQMAIARSAPTAHHNGQTPEQAYKERTAAPEGRRIGPALGAAAALAAGTAAAGAVIMRTRRRR